MILKYPNVLLTMKDEHSKNDECFIKGVSTKSIHGLTMKLAGVYYWHGYYVTMY